MGRSMPSMLKSVMMSNVNVCEQLTNQKLAWTTRETSGGLPSFYFNEDADREKVLDNCSLFLRLMYQRHIARVRS